MGHESALLFNNGGIGKPLYICTQYQQLHVALNAINHEANGAQSVYSAS
jgi:hypothetical protein